MKWEIGLALCSAATIASASQPCRANTRNAFESAITCDRDELRQEDGHAPWTHKPLCVSGGTKRDTKTFCVYTNADFDNKRGISFLTTPQFAHKIARSVAFRGSSANVPSDTSKSTLPYIARAESGRGVGLFATRAIQRGENILIDTPALAIDRNIFKVIPESEVQLLQWRALSQLPDQLRSQTRDLAKVGRGDDLDEILQTNGFGLDFENEEDHVGLLPLASRINHDCRPNAYYHFDANTLTHRVWAIRDIADGEEITQSYIPDPEYSFATRTALLYQTWSFACRCSLCHQSPENLRASDARLSRIASTRTKLHKAFRSSHSNATTIAEDLINLYDEEGLIIPKMELSEALAFVYGQKEEKGKEERARELARAARDWAIWAEGEDSARVKRLETVLEEAK